MISLTRQRERDRERGRERDVRFVGMGVVFNSVLKGNVVLFLGRYTDTEHSLVFVETDLV